ncbi:hypothetical protein [Bacillus wiedmannii]|uniref:Uncharacterized protein n=1 Tax=Bacillus wiedmannii TaxID=1890302 RepID=A0AB73R7S3_9BACI|nr:hypothetical protein [Bacillus wiedmannii]PEK18547.1 hypothetical protein CN694_27195 [Bacillus wiedmannii]
MKSTVFLMYKPFDNRISKRISTPISETFLCENVTKNSGELYTMKAIEEGTLKTHTIAPVNVTLDEKNISLLAEEVYKRINSNLKTGALVRPY